MVYYNVKQMPSLTKTLVLLVCFEYKQAFHSNQLFFWNVNDDVIDII